MGCVTVGEGQRDGMGGHKADKIKRAASAGELRLRPETKNLVGKRYGQVVVVAVAGRTVFPCGRSKLMWEVRCDCGETFQAEGPRLRLRKVTSCAKCREASRGGGAELCGGVPLAVLAAKQGLTVTALRRRRKRGWTDAELVAGVAA